VILAGWCLRHAAAGEPRRAGSAVRDPTGMRASRPGSVRDPTLPFPAAFPRRRAAKGGRSGPCGQGRSWLRVQVWDIAN
jgi:hypothetical protein